jgi:ABC-type phosphate/phosphonate transport system substrate-binding protein
MNTAQDPFIACGMYAFTGPQQSAWRQLFDRFLELSDKPAPKVALSFEHDPALLRAPALWFGHTCGYPLMTALQDYVTPFCVPLFDVPGTEGRMYSSRIIVSADSHIESIEDCRGLVCAMNNPDSNSGMNVLRHAFADISAGMPVFRDVITTGGHLHSLEAVANGNADIAAIDCVSYQLIADSQPDLIGRIRVIGASVQTCGLPLVMAHATFSETDTQGVTDCLNHALATCDDQVESVLHLNGFSEVTLDDYASILEVEQYAVDRRYAELA